MSLSTYQDLKNAIVNWPDRTGDVDLEDVTDILITLAEARINRDIRLQEHLKTVTVTSAPALDEYPLPADYLEMDRVEGPLGESLEMRPATELQRWGRTPCEAAYYAIDGRRLLFAPAITGFSFRYYALLPALSDVDTHWLFAKAPDLYLYASLIEAAIFDKESEQELQRYSTKYQTVAGALLAEEDRSIQPRSQTPRSIAGGLGRTTRIRA